jgi:hypothetical protein
MGFHRCLLSRKHAHTVARGREDKGAPTGFDNARLRLLNIVSCRVIELIRYYRDGRCATTSAWRESGQEVCWRRTGMAKQHFSSGDGNDDDVSAMVCCAVLRWAKRARKMTVNDQTMQQETRTEDNLVLRKQDKKRPRGVCRN